MKRAREQVLELTSDFTQDQQIEVALDLTQDIDLEPWLGSAMHTEDSQQAQIDSELISQPQGQKEIKERMSDWRSSEFEYRHLVKAASEGNLLTERNIEYFWQGLGDCFGLGFIDFLMNKPLVFLKPITKSYSSHAGNIKNYVPLWALQGLSYAMENGQLAVILKVISGLDYRSDRKSFFKRYEKIISDSKMVEDHPIKLCAAIALCYLADRDDKLPEQAWRILQNRLGQPCSIRAPKVHKAFASSRELDFVEIRSRILKGLLIAVGNRCRLDELIFPLVKKSLSNVNVKGYSNFYFGDDEIRILGRSITDRIWRLSTYKKEAQEGKTFSEDNFSIIYKEIIKNDSIDCVWTLFYVLEIHTLPQLGHQEDSLKKVEEKLISYLIIPLKHQRKAHYDELKFAAACTLFCMPSFNGADKSLTAIKEWLAKDKLSPGYAKWQSYAMFALFRAARASITQKDLSDSFFNLLDSHLNPLRILAAQLIENYIHLQVPRSPGAIGYIPPIENETIKILLDHRNSDNFELRAAAAGALNRIIEHQRHYEKLEIDFNFLETDVLDAKKAYEVTRIILGKAKTKNKINKVLFIRLCQALEKKEIDEIAKENIVNIFIHIIQNDIDQPSGDSIVFSQETLTRLNNRMFANPKNPVNSRFFYEYARGIERSPDRYSLPMISPTLLILKDIFSSVEHNASIKEDCFFLLLKAVKQKWQLKLDLIEVFIMLIQKEDILYKRIFEILKFSVENQDFHKKLIKCLIEKACINDSPLRESAYKLLRYYISKKEKNNSFSNEDILILARAFIDPHSFYYAKILLLEIINSFDQLIELRFFEVIIEAASLFDDIEMSRSAAMLLAKSVGKGKLNYQIFVKICDLLIKTIDAGQIDGVEYLLEGVNTIHITNKDYLLESRGKEEKSEIPHIHEKIYQALPNLLANGSLKGKFRELIYEFYQFNPHYLQLIPIDILCRDICHGRDEIALSCLEAFNQFLSQRKSWKDLREFNSLIKQLLKTIDRPALKEKFLSILLLITKFGLNDGVIPDQFYHFCHENLYEESEIYLEISFQILTEFLKRNLDSPLFYGLGQEKTARENYRSDQPALNDEIILKYGEEAKAGKRLTRTSLRFIFKLASQCLESKEITGIKRKILYVLEFIAANGQKIMHEMHDFLKICLSDKKYYLRTIRVILNATKMQEPLADDLFEHIEKNISLHLNEDILIILRLQAIKGRKLLKQTLGVFYKIISDGNSNQTLMENAIFILEFSENLVLDSSNNLSFIKSLLDIIKDQSKAKLHKRVLSILENRQVRGLIEDPEIRFLIKIKKIYNQYYQKKSKNKIESLKKILDLKEINSKHEKICLDVIDEILIDSFSSKDNDLIFCAMQFLSRDQFLSSGVSSMLLKLFPDNMTENHLAIVLELFKKSVVKLPTFFSKELLSRKLKYFILNKKCKNLTSPALDVLGLPKVFPEDEATVLFIKDQENAVKEMNFSKIREFVDEGWSFSDKQDFLMNLLDNRSTSSADILELFLVLLKKGHKINDDILKKLVGRCLSDQKENNCSIDILFYIDSHLRIGKKVKYLPKLFSDKQITHLCQILKKPEVSEELFAKTLYLLMPYFEKNKAKKLWPIAHGVILENKPNSMRFASIGFFHLDEKNYHQTDNSFSVTKSHLLKTLQKFKDKSINKLITSAQLESLYKKINNKKELVFHDIQICQFILFYNVLVQRIEDENLEIINDSLVGLLEISGKLLKKEIKEIIELVFILVLLNETYSFNDYELNSLLFYFRTDQRFFLYQIHTLAASKEEYLAKVRMSWIRYKCELPFAESSYGDCEYVQQRINVISELLKNIHGNLDSNCLDLLFNLIDKKSEKIQSDLEFLIKLLELCHEGGDKFQDLFQYIIDKNSKKSPRKDIFSLYRFIEAAYVLFHCDMIEDNLESETLIFFIDELCDTIINLLNLSWTKDGLIRIYRELRKCGLSVGLNHSLLLSIFNMLTNYKILPENEPDIIECIKEGKNRVLQQLHSFIVKLIFAVQVQEHSVLELVEKFQISNQDSSDLVKFFQPILDQSPEILNGDLIIDAVDKDLQVKEWKSDCFSRWAAVTRKRLTSQKEQSLSEKEWIEFLTVMNKAVEIHTAKKSITSKEKLPGFKLRRAQMLAILCLSLDDGINRIGQMATSQGKSIIIAVVAVFKSFKGHVDIIVNSPIYAEYGANEFASFYGLFGLQVRHNNDHANQDQIKGVKNCYSKNVDIVYGETGQFQFDLLRHEFKRQETRGDRRFDFAIIDEADSNMLDDRGKLARLSETISAFDHLAPIYPYIWFHINKIYDELKIFKHKKDSERIKSNYEKILVKLIPCMRDSRRTIELLKEYFKKEIAKKIELNNSLDEKTKDSTLEKLRFPEHLHDFIHSQIPRWVESAYVALKDIHYEQDYVIIQDSFGLSRIVPVDHLSTGVTQHNTHWSDGLHQFLQLKNGLPMTPEGLTTNFISNITFFNRYKSFVGLTATLGGPRAQSLYKNLYRNKDKELRCVFFPSYSPKLFVQYDNRYFSTEDRWLTAIIDSAIQQIALNRPVLIICANIEIVGKVYERMIKVHQAANVTRYDRSDNHNTLSSRDIHANEIIIATNLAGRALDLRMTSEALKNGGLHLILTTISINKRVYKQAIGRTSRAGQPGTAQLIIQNASLSLGKETYEQRMEKLDAEEAKQFSKFETQQFPNIKKKSLLFEKFCDFLKEFMDQVEKTKKTKSHNVDFAEKFSFNLNKNLLNAALIERWALWFKNIDNDGNADSEFLKFKQSISEDFKKDKLIKNPCYLLQEANELIGYLDRWKHALSQLASYRESIHKKIINNLKAINDPLFMSQAFSIRAYTDLRIGDKRSKHDATEDFLKSIEYIHKFNMPQLFAMKNLIDWRESKKIGRDYELDKQITGKISVYSVVISGLEQAVRNIDRSRKLVTVTTDDGNELLKGTKSQVEERLASLEEKDKAFVNLTFQDLRIVYDIGGARTRDEPISLVKKAYSLRLGDGLQIYFNDLLPTVARELIESPEAKGIKSFLLQIKDLEGKEIVDKLSCYKELPPVDLTIKFLTPDLEDFCFKYQAKKTGSSIVLYKKSSKELIELLEGLKKDKEDKEDKENFLKLKFDLTFHDLSIDQCKYEISGDKSSNLVSLLFSFNTQVLAIKFFESVYKKIDTAFIKLNNIPINKALELLRQIEIVDEPLKKVKARAIHTLFTDSSQRHEMSQLIANGLKYVYEINEKLPFRIYTTVLLGSLAAAQIISGSVIVALTPYTVFGIGVGIGMIADGIGDCVDMGRVGATGEFSWGYYLALKAASLSLTLTMAGFSSLSAAKTAATLAKKAATTSSVAISEVAQQSLKSATSSSGATITKSVITESIKGSLKLASECLSSVISQEDFSQIENILRQEIVRLMDRSLKDLWDLYLPRHFAYTKVCGMSEIEHRMEREVKDIAYTSIYGEASIKAKLESIFKSIVTKAQLFWDIGAIVEPNFQGYQYALSHLIQNYHSRATIPEALQYMCSPSVKDNLEDITLSLKNHQILTAEGFLKDDVVFTSTELYSEVEFAKTNINDPASKKEIIKVCRSFYDYLYGEKTDEIQFEIDKFKEIVLSSLVEGLKSLIVANISTMAGELIKSMPKMLPFFSGLGGKSQSEDQKQSAYSRVSKYSFLLTPPSKLTALKKRSIIRMHGIVEGRLQHLSIDKQLSNRASDEQEEKFLAHYGASMGDIPRDMRDIFEDLLNSNLNHIENFLENWDDRSENQPMKLFLITLIFRNLFFHPIKLYLVYMRDRPALNLSPPIIKSELVALLKKDKIWEVLYKCASSLPEFPKILSKILKKDYFIRLVAWSSLLSFITAEVREKYLNILDRESGDSKDGYLTPEILNFFKKLLLNPSFIKKLRASIDDLFYRQEKMMDTLFDLLATINSTELVVFLKENGFKYAKRQIKENAEFFETHKFKRELTYQAKIEKYELLDQDLILLISIAAHLFFNPLILKKSYQYYLSGNYTHLMTSFLQNFLKNSEFPDLFETEREAIYAVILKIGDQFQTPLGVKVSEFQLMKSIIAELIINFIFISRQHPLLDTLNLFEQQIEPDMMDFILLFNGFIDYIGKLSQSEIQNSSFLIKFIYPRILKIKLIIKLFLLNCYVDLFKHLIILIAEDRHSRGLLLTERNAISEVVQAYVTKKYITNIDVGKFIEALLSNEVFWLGLSSLLQANWFTFIKLLPKLIFHIFYQSYLLRMYLDYKSTPPQLKTLTISSDEKTVVSDIVERIIDIIIKQSFVVENKKMNIVEIEDLREILSNLFGANQSLSPLIDKIRQCARKYIYFSPEDMEKPIIGVLSKLKLTDHSLLNISPTSLLMMHIFKNRRNPNELPKLIMLMSIGFYIERQVFRGKKVKDTDRLEINEFVNRHEIAKKEELELEKYRIEPKLTDKIVDDFLRSKPLFRCKNRLFSNFPEKFPKWSFWRKADFPAEVFTSPASVVPPAKEEIQITNKKPIMTDNSSPVSPPGAVCTKKLPVNTKYLLREGKLIPFERKEIPGNGNCMFTSIACGMEETKRSEGRSFSDEVRKTLNKKFGCEHKRLDERALRHIAVTELNKYVDEKKSAELVNHLIPLLTMDQEQQNEVLKMIRVKDPTQDTQELQARFKRAQQAYKGGKLLENASYCAKLYRDLMALPGIWRDDLELMLLEDVCEIRVSMRRQLGLDNRREAQLEKLQKLIADKKKFGEKPYLERVKSILSEALTYYAGAGKVKGQNEFDSDIMRIVSPEIKNFTNNEKIQEEKFNNYINTSDALNLFYKCFKIKKIRGSEELEEDLYHQCLVDKYSRKGLTLEIIKDIVKKGIAVENVYLPFDDENNRTQRVEEVPEDKRIHVIYTGVHYDLVKPVDTNPIPLLGSSNQSASVSLGYV